MYALLNMKFHLQFIKIYWEFLSVFLIIIWFDIHIKLFSNDLLVNIEDIITRHLKMTRRIIRSWYPKIWILAIFKWVKQLRNCDKYLQDLTQKVDGWLYFKFWLVAFNDSRNSRNIKPLSTNSMGRWNHWYVSVYRKKIRLHFCK